MGVEFGTSIPFLIFSWFRV